MGARTTSLAPWAGAVVAPLAWAIHHQGLADTVYFNCAAGNPLSVAGMGAGLIVLTLGAGLLSWLARGDGIEGAARNRRFIAGMSAGMALLFSLALAYQSLAGALIPGCLR